MRFYNGLIESRLIFSIKLPTGSTLDGNLATITVKEGKANVDTEADRGDVAGITGLVESYVKRGKLRENCLAQELLLTSITGLQGDEIGSASGKFGQRRLEFGV